MKRVLLIFAMPVYLVASPQPAAPVLSCETITNRTTLAELRQRFGDLDSADRRLDFEWADSDRTRLTALWTVDSKSVWKTAHGLKVGMAIGDVDLANGRSFQLRAFETDDPGRVLSWAGGKLEQPAGPCRIVVRLAPTVEEFTRLEWRLVDAIRNEEEVSSDDRRIRPYRAAIVSLGLEWR